MTCGCGAARPLRRPHAHSSYPRAAASVTARHVAAAGRLGDMIDLHTHTPFSDGSQTPTAARGGGGGDRPHGHRRHRPRHGGRAARGAGRRRAPRRATSSPAWRSTSSTTSVTMDMLGYFLAGMPDRGAAGGARGAARLPRRAQRAHGRAPGRAGPAARPRRPRRRRRERRRRPAAHRRGHGAPRVRELDQRSLRALPPPRRPRLGGPAAARAGPRPQAAARVGRPARARAPRHHPHRRRRPRAPSSATPPAAAWPASSATTRCTTRTRWRAASAWRRSTRSCPPAARTTTAPSSPKARLGVGSLGAPVPDEVLADLRCVAEDQLQRLA